MKPIYFAAAALATIAMTPANAASFSAEHGVDPTACNSASSVGAFATGEVITYNDVGCQGGYSVFLDTTAQTLTFTTAIAPFADYRFSEFTVTGISEVTITSLSLVTLGGLFNTTNNPAPPLQLSFTGDSITILFGERSSSSAIFDFSIDGGQAVFAYNSTGSVVPEPASWAMMIAGFGLVGATMRRRRVALAA